MGRDVSLGFFESGIYRVVDELFYFRIDPTGSGLESFPNSCAFQAVIVVVEDADQLFADSLKAAQRLLVHSLAMGCRATARPRATQDDDVRSTSIVSFDSWDEFQRQIIPQIGEQIAVVVSLRSRCQYPTRGVQMRLVQIAAIEDVGAEALLAAHSEVKTFAIAADG